MVDVVFTTVSQVAKYLVAPIGRQLSYLWIYKSNIGNLDNEVGKLKVASVKVQRYVDDAEKNVEKIEQKVEAWQNDVKPVIKEAEKLIEAKASNRCFMGFCPNLINRYRHSKEASRKLAFVAGLLQEEEKFDKVSYQIIPEAIWLTSTKGYEAFESRRITIQNILNALNDGSVDTIGVYGMGGIGKTTLVKELGRQVKKDKLFDEVVFVEVSENPDVKKIQEGIADKLGLKFNTAETERARRLYARLKKEEKILIIFDDIWEDLDLENVGIPYGADHRGCKLLLTARDQNVLSNMDSRSNFLIGVLNADESWSLFKSMAGNYIENRALRHVATDIVKECGGLPIAIVTVAKALRNKRFRPQWEDALRELRMPSPKEFTGVLEQAYSKIALSYNYLKGEELKKTFLLCSLMNNDASISVLFRYVMGLDILKGVILTMKQARNRLEKLVCELKDSCLLVDGTTCEQFSMHDVVRVVATTIAYRDHHILTERNYGLREWTEKDELKKCTKISFADCKIITELWPEGLDCPELEFFRMQMMDSSSKISENFFMGMRNLKVLSLFHMELLSLPSSLGLVINLQTLCLNYGKFEDISVIGQLKKLKILSLRHCDIKQLPREIDQLTQLRLLDLRNCSQLKVIAPDVISSLFRLEELYIGNCSIRWEVEGLNVERTNASLDELKHLSQLTTLEIDIKDDKILPKGLFSKKLDRYKISVGDGSSTFGRWHISGDPGQPMHIESYRPRIFSSLRTLKLKLNSVVFSEEFQGIKNVEFLCLDKLQGVKNVLYELDKEGFPQLKHLYVHNNPDFLCIVDSTKCEPHDAFPILESLILYNLINLENICYGQPTMESFCNLKIIEVKSCVKLKNIFSLTNVARILPQLQRIKVENCQNLKEIFAIDSIEVIDKIEFRHLRFLTLDSLPKLASFYSEVKTPSTLQTRNKKLMMDLQSNDISLEDEHYTVMSLFNEKVVFPNLKAMKLVRIHTIGKIWDSQLPTISSCYQNLTSLIVWDCEKLKYVFPSSLFKSFEQLQHLEICNCKVLKHIVAEGREEGAAATFVFPQVTFLKLNNLPELASFYLGIYTSEWPMLKKLEICDCDKVKIFPSEYISFFENTEGAQLYSSEPQSLLLAEKINPNLEELKLGGIDNMMAWQGQFPDSLFCRLKVLELCNDKSANIPLGMLQGFNNLQELKLLWTSYKAIFSCEEDKNFMGKLTKLKYLELWGLSNLKYIWKQGFKLDPVLQNLEVLKVGWCDKLINVVPSPTSFQNLTVLEIECCSGLINLITFSTAKSLVQLREIKIGYCIMMTEIVENAGDIAKDHHEIVFSKLKLLSLRRLGSLTCFCSGNYTLNFPSLEELIVEYCPNMKIFSGGVLSTPKLKKVQECFRVEECLEGDLNATIQQLHKKVNSNLEKLTLSGKDIALLWQGQFPKHHFREMKVLEIIQDESENIPIGILQRFNNLEELILKVSSYKEMFAVGKDKKHKWTVAQIKILELWGLFNLKYIWKQDSGLNSILQYLEILKVNYCHNLINLVPPSASLGNLTILEVWYCDGLINLVTSSTAVSLVRLEHMAIAKCEMMTEVVAANERGVEKDEIVFDKLKSLSLENLESLTSFCSGNYTFKFPALEDLIVIKCPKMKTFFGGVLTTPRLEKVWEGSRQEYWDGDLNTTIQQLHNKLNVNSSGKDSRQPLIQPLGYTSI